MIGFGQSTLSFSINTANLDIGIGMRYPSIGIANMFNLLGNILTRYIGNIWFLINFLRASTRPIVPKPLEKHNGNTK